MEANPGENWGPQPQPLQRRARRAHEELRSWEHCFNNNCKEHWWEKVDARYYPRPVGEKRELSKNDTREHKKRKAMRTRLEGEGSEKTLETLEGQISDLTGQLDRAAQIIVAKDNDLKGLDNSVRYGANGAPKPPGPRPNAQPRPAQRPGVGPFFFSLLASCPVRAPAPFKAPNGPP